ncbi:hypothetical protein SEEE1319_06459 [Salmonella enterica subsp. enterica serovar Enteritidis str. 653049 13-19]|nr:hypothetical protein SEEE1319_06459 [Salmonella enterica subsp. enterica serovar Enteritidis str. 653049 13-19]
MTTRHLVSLVTGVLILSVLFPIGLSLWLAHRQVEKRFNEELDIFSSRVALRTERVSDQAKAALTHIASFKGEPCSSAHLLAMRRVSYSFRYVQEVLYLKNSIPVCSSLEKESHIPAFPPPMKITRDGYRAWFTAQNDLGIKRYMAALGSDSYIVMIDPASFIDVIPFGAWPIDVAIIGRERNTVVASSGNLDPAILPLIHHETPLRLENRGIQYAIHPFPEMGITIVSWAPTAPLERSWYRQAFIWLPAGIVTGLLAAAFILRILRRLQSPRHRLQDAIDNREINVHYQPIVSLSSGKIVGAEALARWQQADGTFLSPEIFIALAEQTGLTEPLTRLIIDTVFEDMGSWLKSHPEQHISINLEASDLASETLPTLLSTLLNRSQISPSQIALELTEREFADPKPARQLSPDTVTRDIQFILMTLAPAIPASATYKIWMWMSLKLINLLSMRWNIKTSRRILLKWRKRSNLRWSQKASKRPGKNSGYASMAYIMVRAGYTVSPYPLRHLFFGRNSGYNVAQQKRTVWRGTNGWGPCQLHPGTRVICLGCFLPDLTW